MSVYLGDLKITHDLHTVTQAELDELISSGELESGDWYGVTD